jgi:hypothetical protein
LLGLFFELEDGDDIFLFFEPEDGGDIFLLNVG